MKKTVSILFLILILLFIYAPILILAVYSFTDTATIGSIGHFSLDNYITLFTTDVLAKMIWGTLILALISSVLAVILGTCGAIGTFYSQLRTQNVINSLNQIPVVNADVVNGFAICIWLAVVIGISKDTFIPLIFGQAMLSAPFVYLSVVPKLKQMDPALYEAALDLGASPLVALNKVILPQIFSGILSGFAMAITLSLDDYFIATYTKPATFDTISTYVVNATKGAQTEIKTALWALSTIIFIIVIVVAIGMNIATITSEKKEGGKA